MIWVGRPRSWHFRPILSLGYVPVRLALLRAFCHTMVVWQVCDMERLSDSAIRSVLRARLQEQDSAPDTVLIEELGLLRGHVRLDIAVVNGLIHGYEIKSDRDSLRRLRTQVHVYGKILDRATLVVGGRFLSAAPRLVPAWWGLLHAHDSRNGIRIDRLRPARRNPQRDPRMLVELLWLNDAVRLLELRGVARGVRHKPRRVVWDHVCAHFGIDDIASAVRLRLKARAMRRDPP